MTPGAILLKYTDFEEFIRGSGMVGRTWALELTWSLKPKNVFFNYCGDFAF